VQNYDAGVAPRRSTAYNPLELDALKHALLAIRKNHESPQRSDHPSRLSTVLALARGPFERKTGVLSHRARFPHDAAFPTPVNPAAGEPFEREVEAAVRRLSWSRTQRSNPTGLEYGSRKVCFTQGIGRVRRTAGLGTDGPMATPELCGLRSQLSNFLPSKSDWDGCYFGVLSDTRPMRVWLRA